VQVPPPPRSGDDAKADPVSGTGVAPHEERHRAEAERLPREAREELERIVQERTAELRAANAALASEIEQRRRAETLARRHERALRTLSACNEALARAADEQGLLAEVCRIAVDVGGYLLCWVGFAEKDERRTVRPAAAWGRDEGYVASVEAVWSDAERGRGPVGRAIRTGTVQVARHISHDPSFAAWRAEAEKRGFASMIALPLVAEGATLGAIAIYGGDVEALGDDREVALLVELAADLAFGIAALRGRAERARMTGRLMQADRLAAVGTLAAGVAHEINNPLAYLLGGLDFVEREVAGLAPQLPARLDEARAVLAEMRIGGERIRQIVRDLKTLSRADDEARAVLDVRRVADSAVNLAHAELAQRARIIREYAPVPAVRANEARLGQVLVNLLINAAHALGGRDAGPNEIRLRTRAEGDDRVVVEIADTGHGIAPEILGRIFEPFFTTKPVGVGTGLGLWICRNLVAAMGGDIEVESEVGRGSTFRLILPVALDVRAAPGTPETVTPLPRGRVLVVDDDALVAKAICRALAEEYDVVVETCPRRALSRLLADEPFGAVLCDLMMPEMSGMELHETLAASRPEAAHRLAFLTGGAFTAEASQYLDSVPNAWLEKPFDTRALRALVRELIDG
jgi:signal transduction histidine kinase